MKLTLLRLLFLTFFLSPSLVIAQEATPPTDHATPSQPAQPSPPSDSTEPATPSPAQPANPTPTEEPRVSDPKIKADILKEEGTTLFVEWTKLENKETDRSLLEQAAQKFRQAILFSPEPRFYFNLCYTLHFLGKYREAIVACESVEALHPSEKIRKKTAGQLATLRKTVAEMDRNPNSNTHTRPPKALPMMQSEPKDAGKYTWSAGAGFMAFGASVGDIDGIYGKSGYGLSLNASLMVLKDQLIGTRAYIDVLDVPNGAQDIVLHGVTLGIGVYKHIKIKPKLYATPFLGMHWATLGAGGSDLSSAQDTTQTTGFRFQGAITYVTGSKNEHAISLGLDINTFAGANDSGGSSLGLTQGGAYAGLLLSYTYRDSKPLRTNFFGLE